jgi:hypothetical protein
MEYLLLNDSEGSSNIVSLFLKCGAVELPGLEPPSGRGVWEKFRAPHLTNTQVRVTAALNFQRINNSLRDLKPGKSAKEIK